MSRFFHRGAGSRAGTDDTLSAANLSVGAIAGIAIAGAIVLFVGLAPLLVWLARRQDRQRERDDDVTIEHLDMRLPPNKDGVRTSYLDAANHKGGYDSRDEHGDDDDNNNNNGGYESGHGSKRSSLQNHKRLRKKTPSSNASETTLHLESGGVGRDEKGDHVDIAADAITPFLARPYGSSIQYEQRVPYEDEKQQPQQQYQDDVITNMVRLSNKSHSHKRSWNGEDQRADSSRNSNRSSNRSSTTTALINFAGNSDASFATTTTSNRNSATASDRASRPTTSTTNQARNSDSTASNTASIGTIRSWFPPSLGKSLVRKLSFGSRSVEEIIGNPRVLNRTGGDPDAGQKEEISVHDTPRSTPVIVHNVTTGSSDYAHSRQSGGSSVNAANASPVIPRAPASVIHNPRQRSTLAVTPGDAAFKQQQKLMMQQQQAKKQQQQMQIQMQQQHQQQQQQQQQMQLQMQQQQLLYMHQQQQQQMQMQLIHNNGHPLLAQLQLQSQTQTQTQTPPKRPARFRQSATDSELTEILRMTAERLEDRNRSERRQQVVNSAADVAGSEGLRDDSREYYGGTVRKSRSPAKVVVAGTASDKTSARESMLSSDTRGNNISLVVHAAQSAHTSLLVSGQDGQAQVKQQSAASGNANHHRRRISHISFASIISEPDSLVPNNSNRPVSQDRPNSASHQTPLTSPSRCIPMATKQQQQNQAQASPADQSQQQRQHVNAVGGSHRPFSPASTESSALSTLYSEDEPGSAGGRVGSSGSPQDAVSVAGPGSGPERRQRGSRHGGVGVPQGLNRTDSQRKALAEVLRCSRDFDTKYSDPSMSPAPLRLRSSEIGDAASTVDGGSVAEGYSPSMRDFQMIDTETDTIRSIVDGDLSCRNSNSNRHTFESSTIFASYAVQTPRAAVGHDDDPFVSATPQHNTRLSQLFSPLPKDGPRPSAVNAASAAIKGRYVSPSGMTTPSSTGNKASRGVDRSSTMGGIDHDDYLADTTSLSKRPTVHLTKAIPEAETPTPIPAVTPQRRKINMALRCLDGSPTLGSHDYGFETPQVYPETRLSSLYDSYHYSDRSDFKSDGTRPVTSDNGDTDGDGDGDTTIIAHRSSTTLATSPTLSDNNQEFSSSLRQVSARYRRDNLRDADSDHTDSGGTDSDATIERMVQDVLLPSRAENYHDEPYKAIVAAAAHTSLSTTHGNEDGERDTLGRLSTFEGDAKKMNSMRVTQAIAELRRMNSQVSTASGHTASISGSASNGGSDFDSPTLPQLRGGGFSPNKRRSSILGRRNYLAIGGGAANDKTSEAITADDSAIGAGGDEEDGAKEGIPQNASLWRRSNQGRSAAQRRAAWRRTVADPSSAENKRAKSWVMEDKPGDHDQWLNRQSLV